MSDLNSCILNISSADRAGLQLAIFRHGKTWWDRDRFNGLYKRVFGESAILVEDVRGGDAGLMEYEYRDKDDLFSVVIFRTDEICDEFWLAINFCMARFRELSSD